MRRGDWRRPLGPLQPGHLLGGTSTTGVNFTIILFSDGDSFTFGNITNSGTSKLHATRDKKKVEFALRTKIACDKNHINGIATTGTVVSTAHGFIDDKPTAIDKYKKEHSHEWTEILGKGEFKVIEDNSEWEEKSDISDLFEPEDIQ
jgi:hypothetical protein